MAEHHSLIQTRDLFLRIPILQAWHCQLSFLLLIDSCPRDCRTLSRDKIMSPHKKTTARVFGGRYGEGK